MKKILLFLLALVMCLMTFAACSGEPLPDGMEEEALFSAGKDVLLLMVGGEYERVHELLRDDQRDLVDVEDIRKAVSSQLDGAGVYKQIEDHMATGQNINGERYGISVLYCEFSEEDVLVRLCFDGEYRLVGFSLDQR